MKLIGALTSKPYAFKARPWELESVQSIDYHDAMGTNIQVSIRGSQILRVLPKINNHINEEWISDKIRFSHDGLSIQRLFEPLSKNNNDFTKISWQEAFEIIKDKFSKGYFFEGICGNLIELESLFVFKEMLNKIGNSSIETRNTNINLDSDLRNTYLMNTNLEQLNEADFCLLIGTNPRLESPIFNLKLKKNVLKNNLKIYALGYNCNLTYDIQSIGNNTKDLLSLIEGKHTVCQKLTKARKPLLYTGFTTFELLDIQKIIINKLKTIFIKDNWNGFNTLQQNSSLIMGLELNCINQKNPKDFYNNNKLLYICNSDEIILNRKNCDFIIYQGHTGGDLARQADLILPGSTLLEKNGTMINNEGIKQNINFCINPPAQARNDWKIFEALSNYLELNVKYEKLSNIKKKLNEITPDIVIRQGTEESIEGKIIFANNSYFITGLDNFYMTDIISRNSHTMALASNRFKKLSYNFAE